MFSFLKPKSTQSKPDEETVRLLAGLATQQLFVLSLNPSGVFLGDPTNTQEVIAWMEQNAKETAERRPVEIYSYKADGQRFVPFFSSSATVGTFIESDPAHKWKAFTMAGLNGTTLFQYLSQAASSGSTVVFDPRSGNERTISAIALTTAVKGT